MVNLIRKKLVWRRKNYIEVKIFLYLILFHIFRLRTLLFPGTTWCWKGPARPSTTTSWQHTWGSSWQDLNLRPATPSTPPVRSPGSSSSMSSGMSRAPEGCYTDYRCLGNVRCPRTTFWLILLPEELSSSRRVCTDALMSVETSRVLDKCCGNPYDDFRCIRCFRRMFHWSSDVLRNFASPRVFYQSFDVLENVEV